MTSKVAVVDTTNPQRRVCELSSRDLRDRRQAPRASPRSPRQAGGVPYGDFFRFIRETGSRTALSRRGTAPVSDWLRSRGRARRHMFRIARRIAGDLGKRLRPAHSDGHHGRAEPHERDPPAPTVHATERSDVASPTDHRRPVFSESRAAWLPRAKLVYFSSLAHRPSNRYTRCPPSDRYGPPAVATHKASPRQSPWIAGGLNVASAAQRDGSRRRPGDVVAYQ